ncbi:hypothetical protein ABPG74_005731 [Tetrahymena malaccensis]
MEQEILNQSLLKSPNREENSIIVIPQQKKQIVQKKKLKINISQSTEVSYGGLVSPEGETRASSIHHFEREKKWSQPIIPLTCLMLNKAIANINLRLEVEGQPVELVELVGHVCASLYGRAYTMKGEQPFMAIQISDLTGVCQAILYQPTNDEENLVEYLKRTENWQSNPDKMLNGTYVKVIVKPKYSVTEQLWKNNCMAIKIIQNANEITQHNLDVIKCYLERKDGFIQKVKSPIQNNPIYIKAKQKEEMEKRNRIEISTLKESILQKDMEIEEQPIIPIQ